MERRVLFKKLREYLEAEFENRLMGIIVYGSEARNDASPDSDVDVLVLLDDVYSFAHDLRRCVDSLFSLSLEIDRRISAKPVPYSLYNKADCPLFRHAHREGIAA